MHSLSGRVALSPLSPGLNAVTRNPTADWLARQITKGPMHFAC
jgi:hypothetical protein